MSDLATSFASLTLYRSIRLLCTYMSNNMSPQIPVILIDQSIAQAFSIFNPNDWNGESKLIVQSCAVHYGLLIYSYSRIKNIFDRANELCAPRFIDLKFQWEKARWDISSCVYLVDTPELHVAIHSFLSNVKTFLDMFVQLISSEGIVADKIHGFHKKGDEIGGKLLHVLKNNASSSKKPLASLLYDLICKHKGIWIDQAVNNRDLFIHPEKGLSKVMFALEVIEDGKELKLSKILKPTIDDYGFDIYAENMLFQIEEFSKNYIEQIKNA
jgi:hypothetical protein